MKRRKFLFSSGSAILSGSALSSSTNRPAIAIEFEISGVPDNKDPSDIDSILVEFDRLELTPTYIDDNSDATIEIKLDVGSGSSAVSKLSVSLTNGETTDRSDISKSLTIAQDGISTAEDILSGEIVVKVDHTSVSDTYRESFTISGSDILFDSPVVEESLVGWWPLRGANGGAVDYSGNNNDGTHDGTTRNVAGRMGISSTAFDGTNDYVNFGNISSLQGNDLTICAWFKTSSNSSNGQAFVKEGSDSGSWRIQTSTVGGVDKWQTVVLTGGYAPRVEFPIDENTWTHIALTWDNSARKLTCYKNGSFVGSDSTSSNMNTNSNPVSLAANTGKDIAHWEGNICDARGYDQSLGASDIERIYNKGATDIANPPGSNDSGILYYKFGFRDRIFESFEGDALDDFTSSNLRLNTKTNRVYEGSQSVGQTGNPGEELGERPFDETINNIEIHWQETSNNIGSGWRIVDSNGNTVTSFGTKNPQWVYNNGGSETILKSDNGRYGDWIRTYIDIDYSNGTYYISFENLNTGLSKSASNVPLENNSEAVELQFFNMNTDLKTTDNSSYVAWTDAVTVNGTNEIPDSFSSNNGINNGVLPTDGIRGQAGQFQTSSDDTVNIGFDSIDKNFTFSMWIRPTTLSRSIGILGNRPADGSQEYHYLRLDNDNKNAVGYNMRSGGQPVTDSILSASN